MTEITMAGRMNGQRLLTFPLMREGASAPTMPTIQMEMVSTCTRREVQPSWLTMVGLKELIDPAERSAQKKRNVLSASDAYK